MRVSVVIPAYNEASAITDTIDGTIEMMRSSGADFEVIVVDDGSTDDTYKMLRPLPVTVIRNDYNRGYGASLKIGIYNAQYEHILIMDADGTYPSECIPILLDFATDYDMVVGARTGGKVKIPLVRKPAKWLLNELASYLSKKKIPDLNSGIRIMKKSIIEEFAKILPNGFSFTTTITLAMLTNGYRVKFVPIDYRDRKGKSKIRPAYDTLNFLRLIVQTVIYFNPLRVFLPAASVFLLAGVGFLIRDILSNNFGQSSVFFLILSGIIVSIGIFADLRKRGLK